MYSATGDKLGEAHLLIAWWEKVNINVFNDSFVCKSLQ